MDKFNPSSFYLGVVEFFAILLPGILLTYILVPFIEIFDLENLMQIPSNEFASLGMFLLVSYILGNLLMAAGSSILDERLYDFYRKNNLRRFADVTYKTAAKIRNEFIPTSALVEFYSNEDSQAYKDFENKLNEYKKENKIDDLVAPMIFTKEFDEKEWKLFKQKISEIEKNKKEKWGYSRHLFNSSKKPNFYAQEIINVFKWSQAYFRFQNPEALAEIKRLEADSKFFRSLTVTMPIIVGSGVINFIINVSIFLALCRFKT
jgi:hypothetical protein